VTSVARKPLSIALEEIAAGKVRAGDPVEEGAELEVVEGELEVAADGDDDTPTS